MPRGSLTVEQALTQLAETPVRLAALTAGRTPAQLTASPAEDEWSATEVLAHLRSCADVWGGCIATILDEDEPTLRAVNPTTWIKQTDYPSLEFRRSLRSFTRQRGQLLAVLEPLPPQGWSRGAIVTGAGAELHRTVLSYVERMARHERPHLKQVQRLTAPGAR